MRLNPGLRSGDSFGVQRIELKLHPAAESRFKHSAKETLERVDGRVRRRMRSILRRRSGRKGLSKRGADHQRWLIKFFRSLGYWSLADAHALELQSLRGHTR